MLSGCWSENQGEHSISHVSLLTCMHHYTFLRIKGCHHAHCLASWDLVGLLLFIPGIDKRLMPTEGALSCSHTP